jgi:hypothetical protein
MVPVMGQEQEALAQAQAQGFSLKGIIERRTGSIASPCYGRKQVN